MREFSFMDFYIGDARVFSGFGFCRGLRDVNRDLRSVMGSATPVSGLGGAINFKFVNGPEIRRYAEPVWVRRMNFAPEPG